MHIKQSYFFPIAVISSFSLAADECLVPVAPIHKSELTAKGEIKVSADKVSMEQERIARFDGDVEITNDNARITADSAVIDKVSRTMVADGAIQYQDQQIQVQSQDISLNIDSNEMNMSQTGYRMLQFPGRGDAQTLSLNKDKGVKLEDVSFSSCPPGEEDWKMEASSIEIKKGEKWGEAKHARFYIQDVPVFYLPYFAFPVTDERQSGLLFPEINPNNQVGLSYRQPIYWNIAPNYDATISPRIMTQRGLQLGTEFRYLTEEHAGNIHFEYMANDSDTPTGDPRYFYRFTHQGKLSENWRVNADINGLSDDNYIVDLGSQFYNRADTHLFKTLSFTYNTEELDILATFKDFELIGDRPSAYRVLPEVRLDYSAWKGEFLNLDVHSELAFFDNSEGDLPRAARFHVEPTLSLPLHTPWAEFMAETKILHTQYHQTNIENTQLKENVSRTLGQLRVYGSVAFEKEANWFSEGATQTLEPKFQYLYTSYENQDEIGLYDTNILLNDYYGLFREQEFTGIDRISDKNLVTLGVTTRLMDSLNREQFRLSLGQIFFLEDNRILEAVRNENNRSSIAGDLEWNITDRWRAEIEAQISTQNERVERSSVSLEYRVNDNKLVRLGHRYVRDLSGVEINQAGVSVSWDVAKNWQWVGRYYRDIDLQRTTETFTGIQYDSCCWSLRVVWQRSLTNRFDALGNQSLEEYDSGVSFNFAFKGMGRGNRQRSLLDDGLYGYQQPYILGQ